MIDTLILKVMRERDFFEKMYPTLPVYAFDEKTGAILEDYDQYFKDFNHDTIDPETFKTFFFSFQHPKMSDDVKTYYRTLLDNVLHGDVEDSVKKGLTARILELEYATNIGNIVKKYDSGADIDVQRAIEEATETLRITLARKVEIPWVRDDICDLLKATDDYRGFTWRLSGLNESMRPLRPGDFGIIAARPDAGKTSFLTSELTHMAAQVPDGRPIVWMNNESLGQRIVIRTYQSALNKTVTELKELQKQGKIKQEYTKAVGDMDNIRVCDIHDAWNYEVSDILAEMNPGLVVMDMIDNIRFGGLSAGSRTDQALEAMYQWARVLGVRLDCPILATSQVSAEGDGMQYPLMHMLKDSKTGKQGAADFILMIGKSNDPLLEDSRFLSLPKNKLIRDDGPKDPRCEVLFDYKRGRFKMPVAI